MKKRPTARTKAELVIAVIALCERKGGCTLADISTKLGVSKVTATYLIADARAKGVKVKFDVEDGRYYV